MPISIELLSKAKGFKGVSVERVALHDAQVYVRKNKEYIWV